MRGNPNDPKALEYARRFNAAQMARSPADSNLPSTPNSKPDESQQPPSANLKPQQGAWRERLERLTEKGEPLCTPEEWDQAIAEREADQQPPNPYKSNKIAPPETLPVKLETPSTPAAPRRSKLDFSVLNPLLREAVAKTNRENKHGETLSKPPRLGPVQPVE